MHGTFAPSSEPRRTGPGLVLRLALREMRAGLSGFVVFIACIALGVGAIAGISATARSLITGVGTQGRTILGGDLAVSLVQREAAPNERAFLERQGTVSSIATLRAMAVAGDGSAALVEAKAVDARYPSVGALTNDPPGDAAALLAERDGVFGAIADPGLFDRLGLKPGDRITIGGATLALRAAIASEPDKIATGVGFGPRLILAQAALPATGLIQPGSLVRWTYRVSLVPGRASDADVVRVQEEAGRELPDAGWEIRTRLNADPRFASNIERFTQFLTLVGLTALLVGGVGVANAVSAFVDRKRISIGILKSLGAPGRQIVAIYTMQVLMVAALGIALGLAIGAALPFLASWALGGLLPIAIEPTIAPAQLGLAVLYGLLTALAFSIVPLGRAQDVPVSGLFRDRIAPASGRPRAVYLGAAALLALALVAVAVASSYDRRVALLFVGAAALTFGLLRLIAAGLMAAARRLPHPRQPLLRLALANVHRPGALTASLVLSLGLGITLLVTLAVIDGNLQREITRTLPAQAPNAFFIDVPSAQSAPFGAFLAERAPGSTIEDVPMMRGRIVALGGQPVGQAKPNPDAAWVLDGDRGITYAAAIPEGSTLEAGQWWPADYAGPPLVSFDGELARGIGLKLGDEVTVNVLGRAVTARIANLRKVEWRRLGINFVMVFSPNTFAGAPNTHLATLTLPAGADPALEGRILREAARAFPAVTSVRVRDAIEAVGQIVSQLVLAIRIASSVALVASLLVLAGALAAGHRARLYDAVVLKTLGATRWKLLGAYIVEYGVLGLATGLFGLLAGTLAGWAVITKVMHLGFTLVIGGSVISAALAIAVAIVLGLAGTWRILGQKPAPYLRDL
jgi:putative ABC transport system permease protein